MIAPGGMESVSWGAGQIGQACGKYHIIAQLGRGGMADVYLAVARGPGGFNKLLVLKQLPPTRCAETDLLTMFLDEASLAARLNHPNVVQVNEVGHDGDKYFIAMEYLDGQPLVRLLRRLHPDGLSIPVILRIVSDACAALQYVHTLTDFDGTPLGTVHRDVSPHNLFITYAGHVKLVDFGIAKAAHRSTETQVGMLKGKITYMSPEQIHGLEVDGRSDLFALGIVLYEAVTRERMWGAHPQEVDILRRLVNGEVPSSPRDVCPDVPEDVDRICRRALAIHRNDRYSSAREMQEDIEKAIARLPQRATERDIGELVSRLFAEERRTIAAIIERQLRLIASSDGEVNSGGSVPTLGVDGVISVTPSRLRAMRLGESPTEPPPPKRAPGTVLLGVAAFLLLMLLVVWGALSARGEPPEATAPASKPVVHSLKAPASPANSPGPPESASVVEPSPVPQPSHVTQPSPAAERPSSAEPPTSAESPTSAEPGREATTWAKAVPSAKPRMRKRADAQRASADPSKPPTTISAVSTFGPLDGRK